ncbi:cell surface protein [Sinimarinibacterium sp. CAU 1509]|uniref:cell surface protein n=1 Tax=Sinimarinibacterium sp. CAU 1509 TaxID=2562283 RepID=UPI0010AD2873|nr:cell surface protein [Sinimarinibacterium sp. CAU 1509]TJY57326.1 cell surface protein [Sinimarinibacterium sp. CAU 1509]
MTNQAVVAAPMKYLDRAVGALRNLGLPAPQEAHVPAVALISKLATVDEARVVSIARVLQHSSHFNALMRDKITSAKVSDRYTVIVQSFDSIREDAKRMVDQLADGKIDFKEKTQNLWMSVTRGDIPSRFAKIKDTYLEVARDSGQQIEVEQAMLNMYADFRLAMKEGEIQAHELLTLQEGHLNGAKAALELAQAAVSAGDPTDGAGYGRLVMARDEALRALQDQDQLYQIAKDLAESLQVAYSTSEVVMARLNQSHEIKKRVYARSVTFFSTNETVFTALNAEFTAQMGLHESTGTLDAMTDGVSKGLESIADVGDDLLKKGLKAGYGATIRADSVKKLVDAVVTFQETSLREIEDLRKQATADANEISSYVEDGKKRFAALMQPTAQ